VARGGRAGAARGGLGARAAHGRADGAELPRAALGRRHGHGARGAGRGAGGRRSEDPRHAQDHAGLPGAREAGRGRRRRRQPPRRALRRDPHQGEPRRGGWRCRRGGAAGARAPARPARRGRGAGPRGDRRGAARRRAAAAARQHEPGRDPRRRAAGGGARRARGYATIEGLHYVSMGALTHSAPALDLSLALESLPPQ